MASDKETLLNGMFWNAVQKYSGQVVSIVVSMVLARLLSPEDFGVIAIALVIISFLNILCDMGIGPAIIQRNDLNQNDLDNIYTFSCIVGVLLSLCFFLSSWPISFFYNNQKLIVVCQILACNVFFAAANMVPNALMVKNFRFKQIARRTLFLQILSGFLSVAVAYKGGGIYSLLISPVVTAIGVFLYNRQFYKLRLARRLTLNPIKKIFSYSAFQFAFKFINFFAANIDKIVIGKTMSAYNLGYYQKSFQLVQLPLSNIDSVITPVLHPLLSKYQGDKDGLISRYNKVINLLATIGFPLGVYMFFCATEIIVFFYGDQWINAVPVFRILAISAPVYITLSSCGSFFQASNETKNLFYLGVVNSFIMIGLTLIAGLFFRTIESVAMAWSISILSNFFWTYYFIYVRVLNRSILVALKNFIRPVICALIALVSLFAVNYFLHDYYLANFCAKTITFIVIEISALYFTGQLQMLLTIKSK